MDALKRMELVWPSAGRAWELLHGAKEGFDAENAHTRNEESFGTPMPTDRPKKRSADDIMADVNDVPGRSAHQNTLPQQNMQQQQSYSHESSHIPRSASGVHPQPFVQTYASSSGASPSTASPLHAIPPHHSAHAAQQPTNESPLAFFSSYDRWSSENQLGFPAGLSTSVLPTQYSTGFIDDRLAHASASNAGAASAAPMHRISVDSNGASANGAAGGVGGNTRYPQYWSDYNSLGQPSSMLGSMYGMGMLGSAAPHQSTHPQAHSPTHGHNHSHSHGSQTGQTQGGQGGMYMGDHYNMFSG